VFYPLGTGDQPGIFYIIFGFLFRNETLLGMFEGNKKQPEFPTRKSGLTT